VSRACRRKRFEFYARNGENRKKKKKTKKKLCCQTSTAAHVQSVFFCTVVRVHAAYFGTVMRVHSTVVRAVRTSVSRFLCFFTHFCFELAFGVHMKVLDNCVSFPMALV